MRRQVCQKSYDYRAKQAFATLQGLYLYTFFVKHFFVSRNREVNEQQIEKGHYFFENRQNTSTIIVFFGTAHKPKFREIELLLRVFDHLPPPGFGGHVSKKGRRNKMTCSTIFGFVGYSGTRNTL